MERKMVRIGFTIFLVFLCDFSSAQLRGSKCPYPDGKFPHDSYCDYYIECSDNVPYDQACPDGQVFDMYSRHCALPFGVDCTGRPNLQPAQPSEHCPRRWGYYPHETDCNLFWNCNDGVPILKMCPRGLAFDEYRGICNWPDLVQRCDSEAMFNFKCPVPSVEDLLYADPPRYSGAGVGCADFFICVEDPYVEGRLVPRLLSCPEGLSYDANARNCTYSEYVSGCAGVTPTVSYSANPQQYLYAPPRTQRPPKALRPTRPPGRNTVGHEYRFRG